MFSETVLDIQDSQHFFLVFQVPKTGLLNTDVLQYFLMNLSIDKAKVIWHINAKDRKCLLTYQ